MRCARARARLSCCRRGIQSIAGALRDVVERAGGSGVSASQGNILFGAASSSRVNKVQWAAAEVGVSYRQVETPTSELKLNDNYLQINSKGTVPTWVECDSPVPFVLNESNTIVAHLAMTRGGSRLDPRDPRLRMLAWQWQEYGETTLQPALSPVWWGYKFGSGYPLGQGSALVPLEPAKLAASVQKAIRAWDTVDAHLAADSRPFMLGDDLTFGDITCGVHANRLFQMGAEGPEGRFGHLRALRAWYDRLLARPEYVKLVVAPTLKV